MIDKRNKKAVTHISTCLCHSSIPIYGDSPFLNTHRAAMDPRPLVLLLLLASHISTFRQMYFEGETIHFPMGIYGNETTIYMNDIILEGTRANTTTRTISLTTTKKNAGTNLYTVISETGHNATYLITVQPLGQSIHHAYTWAGNTFTLQGQVFEHGNYTRWVRLENAEPKLIISWALSNRTINKGPAYTANMDFDPGNNTLTLHPVLITDAGIFQCVIDQQTNLTLTINFTVSENPPIVAHLDIHKTISRTIAICTCLLIAVIAVLCCLRQLNVNGRGNSEMI